jgi:hypothetical protein
MMMKMEQLIVTDNSSDFSLVHPEKKFKKIVFKFFFQEIEIFFFDFKKYF